MYRAILKETIQRILNQVDLVGVVGEYVQLKKTGKNYMGLCPFHAEKTPSFSVSPEKQIFHCFGCGKGGNVFTFIMEVEGLSFLEAVRHLAERAGIPVEGVAASAGPSKREEARTWMLKAHRLVAQLYQHVLWERKEGEKALAYLRKRGFRPETIKAFQLGYAPESRDFVTRFLAKRRFPLPLMEKAGLLAKGDGKEEYFDRFRGRIIFPIWDHQGQIVGFGGRLLGDGQPKYLNSPDTLIFRKSKQLFNFHGAKQAIRSSQTVVLLEGYADVITAYQAGLFNVTATLGTALSEGQAKLIKRFASKVIICYDGDEAGMQAAIRAGDLLERESCLVKVAIVPDGKDPDEYIRLYGAEAFQSQVLDKACPFTTFKLEYLRRGRPLEDEQELALYVEEALAVISRLKRAVEREHYVRQLAEQFSLPVEALKQDLYRIAAREQRYAKRQERRVKPSETQENKLEPAYINAERLLLAYMLQNRDVALQVEKYVGSRFNDPLHQRLAAYLYAFYARETEPQLSLFVSTLDDQELVRLVGRLTTLSISPEISPHVLEDCMGQILKYPFQEELERKEREKKKAEEQGDVSKAAQMAMEIIDMKKKLKDLSNLDLLSLQNVSWREG